MVRSRTLLTLFVCAFILTVLTGPVALAWTGTYHLDREWVKIWINQDGTIDLFYNITLTLDSGDDINFVTVGQPKADFTVGEAKDQHGYTLQTSDVSSSSDFKVKVALRAPLKPGQTIWFTLTTNVAHMIYLDTQNVGNAGMQFIPTWFAASVRDLRVSIVLPPGVNESMVRTSRNWTNTGKEGDGRLWVYWQNQNLSPGEQYPVGVSFPKEYVQHYDTEPSDGNPPSSWPSVDWRQWALPLIAGGVILVSVLVAAVFAAGKKSYIAPRVSMETLGARRGLTAVEASYLLDMKPTMLVTEILYSLLQKRAVWVESTKPSIKLKVMEDVQRNLAARETSLRYYELDFLGSLRPDGTIDEEKLARTVTGLMKNTEEKMRGYCRRDTIDYYKKVVTKAWGQVEQAGTPELASKAYDEQLLWLLMDPNYQGRTRTAFSERPFEPNPLWFWYWYGYTQYHPHPTYAPTSQPTAQAAKPPTIPGADFANNIATALEKTSNNIVVNLEKFANSIVPVPQAQKASNQPAHGNATCVCACHSCACVCACVSCACACAGGGVG